MGWHRLKREHHNRELAKLALNLQTLEDLRLGQSRIVQVALPACQEPESRWGRAHFLAAFKRVGPFRISTLTFNLAVLGLMAFVLYAMPVLFGADPRPGRRGGALESSSPIPQDVKKMGIACNSRTKKSQTSGAN